MEVPGVGAGQVGAGRARDKLCGQGQLLEQLSQSCWGWGRAREDARRTNETCSFLSLAGQSLLDLEKPVSTESRPQRRPEFRERVYVGLLCERRDLGLKLALSNSPTLEGWTWGK